MNRAEKEKQVASLNEKFQDAKVLVYTDFRGLKVFQINRLRRQIKESGGDFFVVKNRLARLAARGTMAEKLENELVGPVAVALGHSDEPGIAKALKGFAEEHPELVIKAGLMEGRLLAAGDIRRWADLPSREELLAKLLGTLNAGPGNLVRTLNGVGVKLMGVLSALKDQRQQAENA